MSRRYGVSIEYGGTPSDWDEFFDTMKACGRDFIVRTLSSVTEAELDSAKAAMVDHVFVWRLYPTRAAAGWAAGDADATAAMAALTALGISTLCPVYFAIEFDATAASVAQYCYGYGEHIGTWSRIGVLCPWTPLEWLNTWATGMYAAQILEWQYGHGYHVDCNLIQTQSEYALGGLTCRKWESLTTGFGQYREDAGIEPAAPGTILLPTYTATQPYGGVIRWGYKDEELALVIKDEDGKAVEYRGTVTAREGGKAPRVICEDPSAQWDKISCEWQLNNTTVGMAIRSMIENPSGMCPTGIICHVEEPSILQSIPVWPTLSYGAQGLYVERAQFLLNAHGASLDITAIFDTATLTAVQSFQTAHGLHESGVVDQETWQALAAGTYGGPLVLHSWSGMGKSIRTVLDEFCEITGCQWTLISIEGVWHFYFGHQANWPAWDALRDDVEEDTPGTERRLLTPEGEIALQQDSSMYVNRVYYSRTTTPTPRPEGVFYWDEVWCEDETKWHNFGNGVVISAGEKTPYEGTKSIKFTKSYTMSTTVTSIPDHIDLGYIAVPAVLCNMSSWYWGYLWAWVRYRVTTDQGIAAIPRSVAWLGLALHTGAYPGPDIAAVSSACAFLNPNQIMGTGWTPTKWEMYSKTRQTENEAGDTLFDPANVHWIHLRAMLYDPAGAVVLTEGHTWTLEVWFESLQPLGSTAANSADAISQSFVETQAVSEGREQPISMAIQDKSLPYQDADTIAMLTLAINNRTRTNVPDLQVRGIVNPPTLSRFPVQLTSVGVTDISLGPMTITHKPGEQVTEFELGDKQLDEAQADMAIRRSIDRLRAQS